MVLGVMYSLHWRIRWLNLMRVVYRRSCERRWRRCCRYRRSLS